MFLLSQTAILEHVSRCPLHLSFSATLLLPLARPDFGRPFIEQPESQLLLSLIHSNFLLFT